ncbi:hypothetical protein HII36_11320 [Nonomuraea sp. NN258]|uniref:hypothetical protein n=1 Tax=Nonomuraea antri TaxID=2730852 RepID=UPI001568ACE0|nr:hypothetical protein [Nonomuraea antri]NRQ32424.1 hypothetical protein [Nonomuraea antri]
MRHPRSHRLIIAMFALSALLGVAAWNAYQTAAPAPLYTSFDGDIGVHVTVPDGERALDLLTLMVEADSCAELQAEGIVLDEKDLARCGPDMYRFMMTGVAARGAPLCYGFRVTLDGDARLSEMKLDDRPRPATAVIDGKLCRSSADSLDLEPVRISGRARKPLMISRGYTTMLAAPSIMYQGDADADETHVSWRLGRMPLDSIVESGTEYGRDKSDPLLLAWHYPSPEPVPEPTARFEWRADLDEPAGASDLGGYLAGPHARLISIPRKQAAEQALFWAGLLAGAAVSTLTWAGELLLENRRSRR